ncbi:hypothetical protein PMAYCL1PPCAC_01239, partial [Pristionchus mayeri]
SKRSDGSREPGLVGGAWCVQRSAMAECRRSPFQRERRREGGAYRNSPSLQISLMRISAFLISAQSTTSG